MQIKLDQRLQTIAGYVLPGQVAADIGADHNYLACYLGEEKICPRLIAGEKGLEPWRQAVENVNQRDLVAVVDTRLGDGLSILQPGEAATIIIAGMGGALIRNILAAGWPIVVSAQRLILQPQKDAPLLRAYLHQRNWCIVAEKIVDVDGIFYQIIVAEAGEQQLNEREIVFGPCLTRNFSPVFQAYLRQQLATLRQIEERMGKPAAGSRRQEIEAEISAIQELLFAEGEAKDI